jgi:hypothetical protein
MTDEKKTIAIFGDNMPLCDVIRKHIETNPALQDYEIVGVGEYGNPGTYTLPMLNADVKMYGLFRRVGMKILTEGVQSLEGDVQHNKNSLVYGCGIRPVSQNPLFWDVLEGISLESKLGDLPSIENKQEHLQELKDYFRE